MAFVNNSLAGKQMLLIAEKPDLMRTIESVYEEHKDEIPYDVTFTSQRGHLVTLMLPSEIDEDMKDWRWENLPFHPEEHGGWQYKVIEEKQEGNYLTARERFIRIKDELDSGTYDGVIHAGDPGQEGELLVHLVLKKAGNTLPVYRFWTNDLTETSVLNALQNLRDDDHDPALKNLLAAAYARQHSDYRYGMNISEAASLKMEGRVACGRVKTPLLAIVCKREEEIRNFKAKTTYGVRVNYVEGFSGNMYREGEGSEDEEDRGIVWFDTKEAAEEIMQSLGYRAKVLSCEKKRTETYAPKLFKLSSLQVEAGKMGYSDAETLQTIQRLYEQEYLSYPRTDCEYLSSNEDLIGILKSIICVKELEPFVRMIKRDAIERTRKNKRWVNDEKLKGSDHSAIKPTTKPAPVSQFTGIERDIYTLICKRFVAMFLPPLVQMRTTMITRVDNCQFKSAGKTLVDEGYTKVFGTKFNDNMIPDHEAGDVLDIEGFEITEKTTKCPKRYTSPDLIEVCENPLKFLDDKGLKHLGKRLVIGTSATRSAIIRQLIQKDRYMTEEAGKGKKSLPYIRPTGVGEAIIKNLKDCDICKVDLTGYWEERLDMVRRGELSLAEIEEEMRQNVSDMVEEIKDTPMEKLGNTHKVEEIGTCPECGKPLMDGAKSFFCAGWKEGCKFGLFKTVNGSKITRKEFLKLIDGEVIEKSMKSKRTGNTYKQKLKYDPETHRVEFIHEQEVLAASKFKCPICNGEMEESNRRVICKGECSFVLWKTTCGKKLSAREVDEILRDGCTKERVVGLKGKKGTFSAKIGIDRENKRTTFIFGAAK